MISWGRIWGVFLLICLVAASRFEFGSPMYLLIYPAMLSAVLFLASWPFFKGGFSFDLAGIYRAYAVFIATLMASSLMSAEKGRSFIYALGWAAYLLPMVLIPLTVRSASTLKSVLNLNMAAAAAIAFIIIMCAALGIDADGFKAITGFNRNTVDIIMVAPLFTYLALLLEGRERNPIIYASIIFIFIALILNQSRGVWISYFIGILVMMALIQRKKRAILGGMAAMAVLGLALVFLMLFTEAGESVYERFLTIFMFQDETSSSNVNRFYLLLYTLQLVKHYWLLGTGPGGFIDAYASAGATLDQASEFTREFLANPHSPHNIYLRVLVEGGVFSLLAFLFLLLRVLGRIREKARALAAWTPFQAAAFAGVTAIMVDGFFSEAMFNWYFWYNAGVFIAASGIAAGDFLEAEDEPARAPA